MEIFEIILRFKNSFKTPPLICKQMYLGCNKYYFKLPRKAENS